MPPPPPGPPSPPRRSRPPRALTPGPSRRPARSCAPPGWSWTRSADHGSPATCSSALSTTTPWGIFHGGVYTTAVESAASVGASSAVREQGQVAVGLTNTTHFLRPVTTGRVSVEAVPVSQGRTQQLWRVDITDEAGKLVAHGEVRLQNVAGST